MPSHSLSIYLTRSLIKFPSFSLCLAYTLKSFASFLSDERKPVSLLDFRGSGARMNEMKIWVFLIYFHKFDD